MSSTLQFYLSKEGDSNHSCPHTWLLWTCSQFLKGKCTPKSIKSRNGTKTYTKEVKSFGSKPFNVYLSLLFGKLKSHRETVWSHLLVLKCFEDFSARARLYVTKGQEVSLGDRTTASISEPAV